MCVSIYLNTSNRRWPLLISWGAWPRRSWLTITFLHVYSSPLLLTQLWITGRPIPVTYNGAPTPLQSISLCSTVVESLMHLNGIWQPQCFFSGVWPWGPLILICVWWGIGKGGGGVNSPEPFNTTLATLDYMSCIGSKKNGSTFKFKLKKGGVCVCVGGGGGGLLFSKNMENMFLVPSIWIVWYRS